MATSKTRAPSPPAGFDVTCTIGRVEFDPHGEFHPHVAAFKLIGEHDAPGTFYFPMADGRECAVTVEYQEV